MFVENGHKRAFLEALVKDYNTKNINSDNRNDTNRKKIPWISNIGPKIRKEFKKVLKTLLSHLARIYKISYVKTNRNYHLIVILECTSWIVHAMADILANQGNKY